ncbi:MAG: choice-of-anchor D domain-containing protein [Acidobacteria bacterium]|nr:choice-of-anchor D domain-containing protein [Acidobacteriota bacterium]
MRSLLLLPFVGLAVSAQAQFNVRVQIAGNVATVADNGTIQFNAEAIGRPVDAIVSITNRGTGTINITRFELTGATDFTTGGVPAPEVAILPNEGFAMNVKFTPTSGTRATGTMRLGFTDTPPPTPPGQRTTNGTLTLNLAGVAPEYTFTYLPPPSGNSTPISAGGTIAFPATAVNETGTATVVIANRGSGAGSIGSIRSTGAAFSLTSLPTPPTAIDPNREVRFGVRYAPTAIESSTGTVGIEFVDRTVTFNLAGSSTGSVFSYEVVGPPDTPLQPNASIAVPDVPVGEKSQITIRVKNTGNADGRIPAINVQGTGFAIADAPFLPLTLTAGQAATFSVSFSPTTPGRATGRLRVGADSFDVVSNGLGSSLSYNFIAGPVTTTVAANGSVIFPPVAVGQTSSVRFVVVNNGTSPAAVSSVGVVSTGTTFASGAVSLPVSIAPGQSTSFLITFAPTAVGNLTGTLRVDNASFTLTGFGNPPPAIPSYSFSGATGAQQPATQLAVGLALTAAYPLTLNGTLSLNFSSDVFANDPAVQFAVGGRSVNFVIPAGQRNAVFPNGQTTVRLQTGTVAGTIVLSPTFASDGGIALTPATPDTLVLTVPQTAPRVLSVQVGSKTTTGFQVLVTGYATSRQVTSIDLTFTAANGENVPTTRLNIPADASFTAWYQNAASAAFGSQFTATIPITLSGEVVNVTSLSDTVTAVSATITSRAGTSNAVSANIQ